jgi:acyl-coenzyme A synthetase/AMP-(fatty) acid ligase
VVILPRFQLEPFLGAELGPGEPGELLVRTADAMRGSLGDPRATAATIDPGGWLHTGDIVTADEDGWFYVIDRVKKLIKCKGYQVAPAELEAIMLTHPAVADVAVVPRRDAMAGEVPKAFVVLRDPASGPELMTWMAGQVASYRRIREVELTDRIPRSPSGKILRRLLTEGDARAGHPPRASTGGAPAPAVTGPLRWQASLPGRPGRGCAQLVSAARKLAAS